MIREAALEHNSEDLSTGSSTGSSTGLPLGKTPEPKRNRPFLVVSSTKSPLANPRTPIHRLAVELQSCLYFPDPGPLYAVCGALKANAMKGYPVWMLLIGPPESGKTELLKPLMVIEGVRECGDLSGKAALLSGTRAKDKAKDATGGVLKDMPLGDDGGRRGALVMLDFTRTVLAADPVSARTTLGALGMLHDQHYQREVGTDGGRTISFWGRIGFLAACTDSIDHPEHQQANAEMGERCVYYRYPKSEGYHEISSALDNPDGSDKSEHIRALFLAWSQETGFNWNDPAPPRPLEAHEKKAIMALAQFAARARSAVQRDRYNKNEISGITRSALGPRIANTFAQLLRGMEACGCTEQEIGRVLRQCAMDSLPAARAAAVAAIEEGARGISDIGAILRISTTAVRRTLEDLQVHGIVVCDRPDGNGQWLLSDQAEQMLKTGWGK